MVQISVFEGERPMVSKNHKLGQFDLTGIPPAARGVPQIEVTFDIDANSILTVTAVEKGTGKEKVISITNDASRLTKEDIERMVRESVEFADEDKVLKEKIDAKHSLHNYIYSMRNTIEDKDKLADKLDDEDKNTVAEALTEAEDWLNSNDDADKEGFEYQMKELQGICDPIIAQVYSQAGYQSEDGFEDF